MAETKKQKRLSMKLVRKISMEFMAENPMSHKPSILHLLDNIELAMKSTQSN